VRLKECKPMLLGVLMAKAQTLRVLQVFKCFLKKQREYTQKDRDDSDSCSVRYFSITLSFCIPQRLIDS